MRVDWSALAATAAAAAAVKAAAAAAACSGGSGGAAHTRAVFQVVCLQNVTISHPFATPPPANTAFFRRLIPKSGS